MLGFKLRPSCWYIKHFLAEPSLWLLQWNFKLWVSGVPGREVVEVSQYECVCLALWSDFMRRHWRRLRFREIKLV